MELSREEVVGCCLMVARRLLESFASSQLASFERHQDAVRVLIDDAMSAAPEAARRLPRPILGLGALAEGEEGKFLVAMFAALGAIGPAIFAQGRPPEPERLKSLVEGIGISTGLSVKPRREMAGLFAKWAADWKTGRAIEEAPEDFGLFKVHSSNKEFDGKTLTSAEAERLEEEVRGDGDFTVFLSDLSGVLLIRRQQPGEDPVIDEHPLEPRLKLALACILRRVGKVLPDSEIARAVRLKEDWTSSNIHRLYADLHIGTGDILKEHIDRKGLVESSRIKAPIAYYLIERIAGGHGLA